MLYESYSITIGDSDSVKEDIKEGVLDYVGYLIFGIQTCRLGSWFSLA